MKEENWKKFVKSHKIAYKNIRYVKCPAFDNEKVYFTNKGFNHLIKKEKYFRSREEQKRRLDLLPYVKDILEKSSEFTGYRISIKRFESKGMNITSTAQFWSFTREIEAKIVFVIVCQINAEPKHFISVMDNNVI